MLNGNNRVLVEENNEPENQPVDNLSGNIDWYFSN